MKKESSTTEKYRQQPSNFLRKNDSNNKFMDINLSVVDHAQSLCRFGLSERSLFELEQMPAKIQNWSRRIQSLEQYPAYRRIFGQRNQSLKSVQWLASFYERPLKEPSGYCLFAYEPHASKEVNSVYRAAKTHAKKLKTKLAVHTHYIDIDYFMQTQPILKHLLILNRQKGKVTHSKQNRRARIAIKDALRDGISIHNARTRQNLTELYLLSEEIENFRSVSIYQKLLGTGFNGILTQWDELKAYIRFSQAIRYACESNQLSRILIRNWEQKREDFLSASKKAKAKISANSSFTFSLSASS